MRAVTISKYGRMPTLTTSTLPVLKEGLSLVRMHYAPINPSDLNFFTGTYGVRKNLPATMGFEGSGIVDQSCDKTLVGRVVSVMAASDNGTHSTHIALPRENMVVWPEGTKPIDVACAIINPLSAIGLFTRASQLGYQSVLLSAANSALGHMMIRYFSQQGKNVYGIVRQASQSQQLLNLGAKSVFVDKDAEHTELLSQIEQLKEKTCFLDCIGGEFAGSVFNALPGQSTMINYGRLSKQRLSNVDVGGLYYQDKRIEGFWLNTFMRTASREQLKQAQTSLIAGFDKFFTSKVGKIYKLADFEPAMHEALKPASPGKILLDCS